MKLEYVRTDRNGTKIFHDWTCPRCGGAGESDKWLFTGKICYGCGGTGKRHTPKVVKKYTKEYADKLEKRRIAREKKRLAENPPPSQEEVQALADEARKNKWKSQGFQKEGTGFIHSGNTYDNRETLYRAGARWDNYLRAYIAPEPVEGLKGIMITETHAEELCNEYGYIDIDKACEFRERRLSVEKI